MSRFTGGGKGKCKAKRFLQQGKKHRLRILICGGALVGGALIVGGLCAGHALENNPVATQDELGNALEIVMACPGWTKDNVEVGVFVSAESVEDQVVFAGSGSQVLQVGAGHYELVPQLPRLMLADGTVLEVSEPLSLYFDKAQGESGSVLLAYEAVDVAALSDEELASVAETSFMDEAIARFAYAQAREGVVL